MRLATAGKSAGLKRGIEHEHEHEHRFAEHEPTGPVVGRPLLLLFQTKQGGHFSLPHPAQTRG